MGRGGNVVLRYYHLWSIATRGFYKQITLYVVYLISMLHS